MAATSDILFFSIPLGDRTLAIVGLILGVIGVLATIWAAFDARRQRNQRELAVIAAHSVIDRTYGLLIGLKPSVGPISSMHLAAMDDGLTAINQARIKLQKL